MQTDTIMAFQIEDGDTLQVGDRTYLVKGEPADEADGLLFDTVEEDGEDTQIWFAPFDVVNVVTVFEEEEEWEDILIED